MKNDEVKAGLRASIQAGNIPGLMECLDCRPGSETQIVDRFAVGCLMDFAFELARDAPVLMSKGAEAVHSEREAELEREMEAQAQRYELQLAECRKKSAERDNLALQVDQLQARLKLLSDAADWAVKLSSDATREVLNVISQNGEIPF